MPRVRTLHPAASALVGAVALGVMLGGCASGSSGADAADPSVIAERASAVGVAPDLVYTTEVDGYDLAPQSVGAVDTAGMSATWFNADTAAMFTLRTNRAVLTAESCAATPLWDAPDIPVTCTEEAGDIWHRSGGGVDEYVATRDGATIWVIGRDNTPTDDVRAAAAAVRVPSKTELDLLFSDAPEVPAVPVERGDLPENGDGAPINPSGPGG